MGVLHGRDLFSSKYITAEIKDASKRLWYVPIKSMIGDYFLAEVNKQIYCFKLDNEICQYREKLAKQFQVVQYDTKHYLPMKSNCKDLEMTLQKNSLPRVNGVLARVFQMLGRKEKKGEDFTPHDLKEMIAQIQEYEKTQLSKMIPRERDEFAQNLETIITYLHNLGIDRVVTPVKGISDFIEDDLKSTDPKFLGTIATTLQNIDYENKKMTNTPVSPALAWMKWALVVLVAGMIVFLVYYAYENGYFDSITNAGSSFEGVNIFPSIPTPTPAGGLTDAELQAKYTPEELKAAIDRGEVDYDKLSPTMKDLIDGVELPTVTAEN